MDRDAVQSWLDRYRQAWRANRAEPIAALFSEDAVYRYAPFGAERYEARGRAAIVEAWLEKPDDPGSWEAEFSPYAVDGDRAVATGISRYAAGGDQPARTYHNVFLMRFAPDGRCAEFTEYYMREDPA